MQEEQVDPLEPHAREALLEAAQDVGLDFTRARRAKPVLGCHTNSGRQLAGESLPDDAFRLPAAIGRRHVEKRDAAFDRSTYGRDTFLAGCGSPKLTYAAPSKSERTYRPEAAEHSSLHELLMGVDGYDSSALQRSVEGRGDRTGAPLARCIRCTVSRSAPSSIHFGVQAPQVAGATDCLGSDLHVVAIRKW